MGGSFITLGDEKYMKILSENLKTEGHLGDLE
jgi:hypothetical protein